MHTSCHRHGRFLQAPLGPVLGLFGAAVLAGCTGQVAVKSAWQGQASRGQTFTRVLVVGVSPDYSQRCKFEYWLVKDLRSDTVAADSSCNSMAKDVPLNRENIERVVAALHSDAVLSTSLVQGGIRMQEGGTADTRGGGNYEVSGVGYATGVYGFYGMPMTYVEFETAPPITAIRGEVHVLSRLYAVSNAALIYSIDTKARDLEDSGQALAAVTPAIAERLRRDGLIH